MGRNRPNFGQNSSRSSNRWPNLGRIGRLAKYTSPTSAKADAHIYVASLTSQQSLNIISLSCLGSPSQSPPFAFTTPICKAIPSPGSRPWLHATALRAHARNEHMGTRNELARARIGARARMRRPHGVKARVAAHAGGAREQACHMGGERARHHASTHEANGARGRMSGEHV